MMENVLGYVLSLLKVLIKFYEIYRKPDNMKPKHYNENRNEYIEYSKRYEQL